jgi:hypothetical protein
MSTKANAWFTVIISSVIIGLSVGYILEMWGPGVTESVLCTCVAIIACRSIQRIISATKQICKEDKE